MKPRVLQNKCIECYTCVDECPTEAIIISSRNGKAYILKDKCTNCGLCLDVCPVKAIRRKK